MATSSIAEEEADAALYTHLTEWDEASIEQLAKAVKTLPEAAAAKALWLAASAPPSLNAAPVLIAALSSTSPLIRVQAADVMIAMEHPNTLHPLIEFLNSPEADAAFARHVAASMATKSSPAAIRLLMLVMLSPNLKDSTAEVVGEQLRRLTRANLPNNPEPWRAWWREQPGQGE